jgi:hypothetical protein
MTLQEAYLEWVKLMPAYTPNATEHIHTGAGELREKYKGLVYKVAKSWNGSCCSESHRNTVMIRQESGVHIYDSVDAPDDHVCLRERAWRQYIRIRDGILV